MQHAVAVHDNLLELHGGELAQLGLGHGVVGADDLDVKPGADPHGIGIDQFLADEGGTVTASAHVCWVMGEIHPFGQLLHQGHRATQAQEVLGAVMVQPTGHLVEVRQAIPASGVGADALLRRSAPLRG